LPYTGSFPKNDLAIRIYDSGQPNCAFQLDLKLGDYFCKEDNTVGTICSLVPPEILCR